MSEFKPGEVVDITIKGVRVDEVGKNRLHVVMPNGTTAHIELSEYEGVTVERADPEWWPLLPGDVLRHTGTGRLWFGVAHASNLCLYASNADCMDPQQTWEQRHQLALVHREDEQDGGGWEDPGNGADFFACEHKTTDEPGHDPSVCRRLTDAETDALTHGSAEQDGQSRTPTAGTEVPNRPGRVFGDCGHPVWRAVWDGGERTCQPCQDAFAAEMSGGDQPLLLDPDCRDGKHGSCVGGLCECVCHEQNGGRSDG